jgi:NAD(P)-dependent dehydrogenase (short-subunit alcohol dehydrogenase family)
MITGGAQGLGHAMTERFAAEGATVAVGDHNSQALGRAKGSQGSSNVRISQVDVSDPRVVEAWADDTISQFGRVDVLINNAGIIRDNRLERMTDAEWQSVINVNLRGTFNCCRAVFGQMKAQGYGRILSISSISWLGNFGQANYSAAKAGIVGLARTVALEGAAYGVTSNVVSPGLIDTPMLAALSEKIRSRLEARVPMARVGGPADIAEAAAFLCSKNAGYITGVVLDVDGGMSIGSAIR